MKSPSGIAIVSAGEPPVRVRSKPRATPARWRRDHLVEPLLALAYFERASAHISAGWLPRLVSIDSKIAVGQHQYQSMQAAARLERAYVAMQRYGGPADLSVPRAFRTVMRAIDGARSGDDMLRRLYGEIKPALALRYAQLIARADRTLDAHLLETIEPALDELDRQIAWARPLVGAAKPARVAAVVAAASRPSGPRIGRQHWLWRPLCRVPHGARPPELKGKQAGEMMLSLGDAPGTPGAAGFFFHSVGNSELSTMELYGRCSYEHPDMPEAFHHDYSRITADEARHTEIAVRYAARFGRPIGTFTISSDIYSFNYEYEPCEPGSKRELLWRLLLQGTLREGLIVEGFMMQGKKFRHSELAEAARVAEAIAAEEVPHVEIALKWSRHLCGGDDQRTHDERERAHEHYAREYATSRKRFVERQPDRAIEETAQLQAYAARSRETYPFSLKIHVNRSARHNIGFTDRDIDQILRWGYLQP